MEDVFFAGIFVGFIVAVLLTWFGEAYALNTHGCYLMRTGLFTISNICIKK